MPPPAWLAQATSHTEPHRIRAARFIQEVRSHEARRWSRINDRDPQVPRGSLLTPCWRELDSNLRFPNRSASVFPDSSPVSHGGLTVSRPGTGSSNPSPSTGESSANHRQGLSV